MTTIEQGCGINNCDCDGTTMEELMAWDRVKNGVNRKGRGAPLGLPTMHVDPIPKQEQVTRPERRKNDPLGLPTMHVDMPVVRQEQAIQQPRRASKKTEPLGRPSM